MDETHQRRLLLAYAIATYDSTLTGMEALRDAGFPVPYGTTGAVRRTLRAHAHEWDAIHGHHLWTDTRLPTIVAEARTFCTEHQQDVDELERGLTPTTERE